MTIMINTFRAVMTSAVCWTLIVGIANGQSWREEGPGPIRFGQVEGITSGEVAGDIQTIATHPTDPNRMLAGAVNGGIWETFNALSASPTWEKAFLPFGIHNALSITDISYDPTDNTNMTVWATIGEASSFGRVGSSRLGLLKSTDGGFSFSFADASLQGKRLVNVLGRGNTVVVAAENSDAFTCPTLGLFRSTDGGTTFTQIPFSSGLPGGIVDSLIGVPGSTTFMLASVNFASACSAGGSNGIYFSDDSGATWAKTSTAAMDALIEDGSGTNVKMSFGPGGTYYVGIVPASTGRLGGVFSTAGGGPWTAMDLPGSVETVAGFQGIHPGGQGDIHFALVADPVNIGIVYISGDRQPCSDEPTCASPFPNSVGAFNFTGRLFKGNSLASPGSQWTPLTHNGTSNGSAPHADSRDMEFDVAGNLIESDDGGVYRRSTPVSGTGDWFSLNGDLQVTEFYSIAYDPLSDTMFGGSQDTGTPRQVSPGFGPWNTELSADGGDVAIDLKWANAPSPCPALTDFSVRYLSFQNLGAFRRLVYDENNAFRCINDLSGILVDNGGTVAPQFNTAIEVNADVGMRLVIGAANGVFESFDGGTTVGLVSTSPAITLVAQPGHKKPMAYGAAGNTEALYVGGCEPGFVNCGLWVRTDTGLPLTKVTSAPFNVARTVESVVMDPDDSSRVFVLADSDIFVSQNFGTSWAVVTNLPASALGTPVPISMEYIKPSRGSPALVVGTEQDGVFIAPAAALTSWTQYGTGLAQSHVFKLEYDQTRDKLVAGLLGRGAWSLQCSDEFEPDDASGDANPIISGEFQTHSICPVAENDYTTFTLTRESAVSISALSGGDGVFLLLADSDVVPIETQFTPNSIERECGVDALPPGDYFIYTEETGDDAILESYELRYTATPCPSADIAVSKTLDTAGPYLNDQTVQYTIVVSNAGLDPATNVMVTDTPTNLVIDSVISPNCSAMPCTLTSLAVGATETITVMATIDSAGSFDNAVTVSATELDPNTGNNTANAGSTASAAADISVTKSLDTMGPYLNGQSVQFTIIVGNAGPDSATSLTVTDTPTNLTIDSASSTNCASLPCLLASLDSGASETITVMATINGVGSFSNAVGVSANETDPNTGNNTANVGSTVGASADIAVIKTLDTIGPFTTGQTVQFTIAVSNAGPDTATNVMVTDTPTNLTLELVSSANCSALPCIIASLASGAQETITVNAMINSAGTFNNAVTVAAFEADPNTGDNSSDAGSSANDLMAPEIDVQGNGVSIVDGDTTPQNADNTDFGSTVVEQAIVRTFVIRNTGNVDLNLTADPLVSVSGSGYSITQQPASGIVLPAGSVQFDVTFTPISAGVSSGVIIIQNDDTDESLYDFVIQGEGTGSNTAPNLNDATFDIDDALFVGDTVGQLIVTDAEGNIPVSGAYQIISGNTGGAFAVQDDGRITVLDEMALTSNFTLTVQVTDSGSLADTATVTINVAQVLILRDSFGSGF